MSVSFYNLLQSSLVLLILGALTYDFADRSQERNVEQFKMMKTKTLCVGRMLIDIPEVAHITYRGARIAGWEISAWPEDDERFLERIRNEELKLRLERNGKDNSSLEQVYDLKEPQHGKILVFNRMWLEKFPHGVKQINEAVSIKAYVRLNAVTYNFYGKLRAEGDVDGLKKIIRQLRWRDVDEIPGTPGFCFQHGIINDPLTADQSEFTAVFVGLPNHPDLTIAFSTYAGVIQNKSLLQRDSENNLKHEFRTNFHTFYRGSRILNGIPGEEILDRVDEPNGSLLHAFMWESLTTADDVYRPLLTLELDTGRGASGVPVNSTLSDDEVRILWEKIATTVRIRPASSRND